MQLNSQPPEDPLYMGYMDVNSCYLIKGSHLSANGKNGYASFHQYDLLLCVYRRGEDKL